MRPAERRLLDELARLYGIQTEYRDVEDRLREAPAETLWQILRVLGADATKPADLPAAIRTRKRKRWERVLPPVCVAWKDSPWATPPLVTLNVPLHSAIAVELELTTERGHSHGLHLHPDELRAEETAQIDEHTFARYLVPLDTVTQGSDIPTGYHRLDARLETGGAARTCTSTLIVAPARAYAEPPGTRTWGIFAPLYAVRGTPDWGVGDFGALSDLLAWTRQMGGRTVGTLPLLAAFLDTPFAPSPYVPVSRLFWNELFLDVGPGAATSDVRHAERLAELRSLDKVDYRRAYALKRAVLSDLAEDFFSAGDRGASSDRGPAAQESYRRFLDTRPRAADYARFRATVEARAAEWHAWPERLREGTFAPGDYDENAYRFHLFVQWLAEEQLAAASPANGSGGYYLDLPLGVHPGGYDTWRERESFAFGAAGGAPPDTFFSAGQNWGFPPLHPERLRETGYSYLRESLAFQMSKASHLRIDHVMGLHRLYWIPDGLSAKEGAYVTYPAEELYAILCLESHRNRTVLVGEDLGTVPDYVRPAMERHGLRRMYVLGYEASADSDPVVGDIPPESVASLDTHDMPPFAGFFRGSDIDERVSAGHLDADGVGEEIEERRRIFEALEHHLTALGAGPAAGRIETGPAGVSASGDLTSSPEPSEERIERLLRAALRLLARSEAELVLVNLEDLLLSTTSQNLPGTTDERPNWRVRIGPTLAELRESAGLRETLREVDRLRQQGGSR